MCLLHQIEHKSERELALEVLRFAEVIEAVLADLLLHRITEYVWDLTQK